MSSVADRHYFHYVPGLMVPINADFEIVDYAVNKFIDLVPNIVGRLEDDLASKRYVDMRVSLEQRVLPLLKDIYARSLESHAAKLLRMLQDFDTRTDQIPEATRSLISDINSLSIQMQNGQRFGADKNVKAASSSIEMQADRVKNLSTVSRLIDEGENLKALSIITEMADLTNDALFPELLKLAAENKYDEIGIIVHALKEEHTQAVHKSAGTDLSKMILAVDDMPEILMFVNSALKSHYKVLGAQSGNKAIQIMAEKKPDLFILDIDMPGMDGFELAGTIRSSSDHADTPIIFLTGNSSRERFKRAVKLRANDFIVKPTTHEILLTKVGKFLNET